MGKNVIEVRGIGKQYRLGIASSGGQYRYKSLRDILASLPGRLFRRRRASKPEMFWALKDVSFDAAELDPSHIGAAEKLLPARE